jgi:hypothetical protein
MRTWQLDRTSEKGAHLTKKAEPFNFIFCPLTLHSYETSSKFVGSATVPTIPGGHGGPPFYIAEIAYSINLAASPPSWADT